MGNKKEKLIKENSTSAGVGKVVTFRQLTTSLLNVQERSSGVAC